MTASLHLGPLALGNVPRVVLALGPNAPESEVHAQLQAGVDLLEFRVDLFADPDPAIVLHAMSPYSDTPILGTVRMAAEGGEWKGSEASRAKTYASLLQRVDAIDVELAAQEVWDSVVPAARSMGRLVLGSYHNFDATPPLTTLNKLAREGKARGADIIKVAATCAGPEDVATLARFTLENAGRNVAVIGMGPRGMLTRIFFPAIGSLLTYTFLNAPTAPGQLSCAETLRLINTFFPNRAHNTTG